jgi:hypothetical protein
MPSEVLIALFACLSLVLSTLVTMVVVIFFSKALVRDEAGKRDLLKGVLSVSGEPAATVLANAMEQTDRAVDIAVAEQAKPAGPGPRRVAQ